MSAIDFQALYKKELAEARRQAAAAAAASRPASSLSSASSQEQTRASSTTVAEDWQFESHRLAHPEFPKLDVFYVRHYIGPGEQRTLLGHILGQDAAPGQSVAAVPSRRARTSHAGSSAPLREFAHVGNRQVQVCGGVPHPNGMFAERLPDWLESVGRRLLRDGVVRAVPNQCLINYYPDGCGISPHRDGELFTSQASIISLGAPAVMHFALPAETVESPEAAAQPTAAACDDHGNAHGSADAGKRLFSVLLEPGSLLVFSGRAFTHLTHAIDNVRSETLLPSCLNLRAAASAEPSGAAAAAAGQVVQRGGARVSMTLRTVRRVVLEADDPMTAEEQHEKERRFAWWLSSISERATAAAAAAARSRP